MPAELGPAKVTVILDTQEARRQIAELRASIGRPAPGAPTVTPTTVEGAQALQRQRTLDQLTREIRRSRHQKYGNLAGSTQETGERKPLLSVIGDAVERRAKRMALSSPAAGLATGVAASRFIPQSMVGVAKGIGVAAAIYGAARIGTEAQVLTWEALRAAMPQLIGENPVAKMLMEGLDFLAKKFDSLESSVKATFQAVGTTGEYAVASARIAGEAPRGDIARQYTEDLFVEREKNRLDYAFSRFRMKQVPAAIGKTLGEIVQGWNR